MRSVFAAFAALAALAPLAQTSAIPYRRFDRRWNDAYPGDVTTDPLPPSKDPFYQLPDSVKSAKNGDVLKSRPVWTQFDAYSRGTYQLLYKTTNPQGEATGAVTTVFTPLKPANPPQIMLLMTPIDSACPDCEPAFALQSGSASNGSSFIVPTIAIDIVAGLSKGWYVTVPDHDGLKAAFFAGVVEAFAGLDGLRALLNFPTVLPCIDNYKAVIHGYSGGAHASAWASQFLKTYGSGLNVIAAAYGGTPVDSTTTLNLLNQQAAVFLDVSSLAGLANAYPELQAWYAENLNANGTRAFALARSLCNTQLGPLLAGINVYDLFKGGEAALLNGTIPQKYINFGLLGKPISKGDLSPYSATGVVGVPTFMYHSSGDETVSYKPVPAYVQDQCAQGAKIAFATVPGLNHTATSVAYTGDVYNYLSAAFNGTLNTTACSNSLGIQALPGTPAFTAAIGPAAAAVLASSM
ncbi:hypothetical protein JCM8115_001876 [Rhodotorula mucilaginosa]|uniref:triacylglycerol lipase n=1 Tax=Rhodotorula mucilaginosa TaxID=5537 RepID=A0A9P6VYS3_RHOMI|nr:hypothetical protein C6P46_006173 [Rhodotorula mucilaginosa]TKA50848.1 hypothetical protein B0A53_05924 [Rhodotorula sp. CCFEE 5036]